MSNVLSELAKSAKAIQMYNRLCRKCQCGLMNIRKKLQLEVVDKQDSYSLQELKDKSITLTKSVLCSKCLSVYEDMINGK